MEFVIGGLAAAGATAFTNPLDVVKHEMEMNKKNHITRGRQNFLQVGCDVAKNKGWRAMQAGLSPAVGAYFVNYALKLGIYHSGYNYGLTIDTQGELKIGNSMLLGGLGGCLGQYLSNPFYLIKTQKELDILYSVNQQEKKSDISTITKMYRDYGLKGFFRGASASLPRAFLGTSQLTSYALARQSLSSHELLQDLPLLVTILASTFAAFILTLTMTPFDLVLNKLYKQAISPQSQHRNYNGFLDCVKKTYGEHGVKTFYSALGPISMKLGTHTVLCLVFWELLKNICDNNPFEDHMRKLDFYLENFGFHFNRNEFECKHEPCNFYWS